MKGHDRCTGSSRSLSGHGFKVVTNYWCNWSQLQFKEHSCSQKLASLIGLLWCLHIRFFHEDKFIDSANKGKQAYIMVKQFGDCVRLLVGSTPVCVDGRAGSGPQEGVPCEAAVGG